MSTKGGQGFAETGVPFSADFLATTVVAADFFANTCVAFVALKSLGRITSSPLVILCSPAGAAAFEGGTVVADFEQAPVAVWVADAVSGVAVGTDVGGAGEADGTVAAAGVVGILPEVGDVSDATVADALAVVSAAGLARDAAVIGATEAVVPTHDTKVAGTTHAAETAVASHVSDDIAAAAGVVEVAGVFVSSFAAAGTAKVAYVAGAAGAGEERYSSPVAPLLTSLFTLFPPSCPASQSFTSSGTSKCCATKDQLYWKDPGPASPWQLLR